MDTAERFLMLKNDLMRIYSNLCEEIDGIKDVKQLDTLMIRARNFVDLQFRNYKEDVRKIFASNKIDQLNQKDVLTDDDCKGLVVGGGDELSELTFKKLEELVINNMGVLSHSDIMDMLNEAFGSEKTLKTRALRWVLRGLSVDHAITKIQYDNKIYKN